MLGKKVKGRPSLSSMLNFAGLHLSGPLSVPFPYGQSITSHVINSNDQAGGVSRGKSRTRTLEHKYISRCRTRVSGHAVRNVVAYYIPSHCEDDGRAEQSHPRPWSDRYCLPLRSFKHHSLTLCCEVQPACYSLKLRSKLATNSQYSCATRPNSRHQSRQTRGSMSSPENSLKRSACRLQP